MQPLKGSNWMKTKKIVIHIDELIKQENISLRELGRQADIQISALSPFVNGKKQRIDLTTLNVLLKP